MRSVIDVVEDPHTGKWRARVQGESCNGWQCVQVKGLRTSRWAVVLLGFALACGPEAWVRGDPASSGSPASRNLSLAESPDFSLSEAEEGTRSAIFRAFHGAALDNGLWVVAHDGPELIYVDSTGATVHVGRDAQRDPPRPAGRVDGLFAAGDQVVVSEFPRRTWWYSERGDPLGTVDVPIPLTEPVLAQGYLAGVGVVMSSLVTPSRPARTGEPRRYRVYDREGNEISVLDGPPEPGGFGTRYRTPAGGIIVVIVSVACAAQPLEAVLGSEIFAADAAGGVLFAIDARGSTREVYRAPERVPMARVHRDFIRSQLMPSDAPAPPDTVEAVLARVGSVGDPLPAWTGIIPDPTGRLWLMRQECVDGSDLQVFDIISRTGEFEGSLEVPPGLRVRAVYGDRVLVTRRDEWRVEYLEQYRIER